MRKLTIEEKEALQMKVRGLSQFVDAKPCPFCGSTRIVKGERYFAMCVDCGATGPERNADATQSKFVGDWNTRHET